MILVLLQILSILLFPVSPSKSYWDVSVPGQHWGGAALNALGPVGRWSPPHCSSSVTKPLLFLSLPLPSPLAILCPLLPGDALWQRSARKPLLDVSTLILDFWDSITMINTFPLLINYLSLVKGTKIHPDHATLWLLSYNLPGHCPHLASPL